MKGVYILGCIKTNDRKLLKSAITIKNAVSKICIAIGLKIVGEKYHIFRNPNGITYCFILSQSHFVVHTWPEECKVFFDIFTCDKELSEIKCVDMLSKEFKGEVKELKRIEYR